MMEKSANNSFLVKMLRTVGPGTIVMMIVVVCFVSWQLLAPRKVLIEHRIETRGSSAPVKRPSAARLLNCKVELGLDDKQAGKLTQIAGEERQHLAPLDAEIKSRTEEFDRWSKTLGSHSLSQIEAAAKPISELGFKKRQLTSFYSQRAFDVLSPPQQDQIEKLNKTNTDSVSNGRQGVHE